jgi:hypothetical protein
MSFIFYHISGGLQQASRTKLGKDKPRFCGIHLKKAGGTGGLIACSR